MNPLATISVRARTTPSRLRQLIASSLILLLLMQTGLPVSVSANVSIKVFRPQELKLMADPDQAGIFSNAVFEDLLGISYLPQIFAAATSRAVPPESDFKVEAVEESVKNISTQITGDRTLNEGDVMSLGAVPFDANGAPINGLAPRWRSSDPETVRVIHGSQAVALRPGEAQLVVSAGKIQRMFRISVTGAATSALSPPDEPVMTEQQALNLTTPENNLGNPPGQSEMPSLVSAAAARTRERHGSANYSFDLLAASLPGRGVNASVNITYNSRVWNKSQQDGFLGFQFNTDENWLAPGFSLGFGSLQAYQTNTGFAYLLTATDGTRTQLVEKQSSGSCRKHESTDGGFTEATTCDGYDAPSVSLRYTNGARVTYGAIMQDAKRYPIAMQDRNGNYITISYVEGSIPGKIFSIRDTLNRYINFHYDNTPAKKLIAITVPGTDDSTAPRQTIRFYYETLPLNTTGRFIDTAEVTAPASIEALRYVYFPGTQTGFRYDYSPYFGMIYRISQMRGMQVSSTSLAEGGAVVGEGTCSAWTHYNYPSAAGELGPPLTDVPKYSWRKDDWLGRTTDLSQTSYSTVDAVSPAGCEISMGTCSGTRTTTITAPDGTRNVSVSLIRPPTDWQNGLLIEAAVVSGESGSETVWSKSKFYWQQGSDNPSGRDDPRVERIEVTNEVNQTRATSFGYDSYNNRTVIREHDFAAPGTLGPELNRTEIAYETRAGWINNRLVRLPVQIRTIVGGVVSSKIVYEYDDYSGDPLSNTPGVMQHLEAYNPYATGTHPCNCRWECASGAYNGGEQRCSDGSPPTWVCHDVCPNYDPATAFRGNVTKTIAFPDTSAPEDDPDNAVTTFKYDMTGNVRETGASCCRQSSYTYSESTGYAYPVQKASGDAGQLVSRTIYDRNTGLVKSVVDENDQTTRLAYDPASLRVVRVDGPNGAWSTAEYNDTTFPYHVKSSVSLDTSRSLSSWSFMDGRGRQFRTRSQSTSGYLSRDAEFDSVGRAVRSFNPYTVTNLSDGRPAGIKFTATTQRDGLGRPLSISLPDNTTVAATYSGLVFTARDQTGKTRRQITDGLGRVIRVDEPGPNGDLGPLNSPVQPTYYDYS